MSFNLVNSSPFGDFPSSWNLSSTQSSGSPLPWSSASHEPQEESVLGKRGTKYRPAGTEREDPSAFDEGDDLDIFSRSGNPEVDLQLKRTNPMPSSVASFSPRLAPLPSPTISTISRLDGRSETDVTELPEFNSLNSGPSPLEPCSSPSESVVAEPKRPVSLAPKRAPASYKIHPQHVSRCRAFYQKYLQKLFPKGTPIGYYPYEGSRTKKQGTVNKVELNDEGDPTFTINKIGVNPEIHVVSCSPESTPLGRPVFKAGARVLVWYKEAYVLAEILNYNMRTEHYSLTIPAFADRTLDVCFKNTGNHDLFLPPFCRVISADNVVLNELDPKLMNLFRGKRIGTVYCRSV